MAKTRTFLLLLLFGPGNKASHGVEERGARRRRWEEKKKKEREGERESRKGKRRRKKKERGKRPCREEYEQR